MVAPLAGTRRPGDHALRDACFGIPAQADRLACVVHLRRLVMQWTTPTACDLRFGFEITMYVSAR
jgi:coenzyme PQQ precursor peptide PqqA